MSRIPTIAAFAIALLSVLLSLPTLSAARQEKAPKAKAGAESKHRVDAFLDACMEKNYSTQGMLSCLRQADAMWDKEMNSTYKKLLTKLTVKGQADIRASQRAWIAFRDKEYKSINSVFSQQQGTMFLPMHADASMRLTKERALQLQSLLDIYSIGED